MERCDGLYQVQPEAAPRCAARAIQSPELVHGLGISSDRNALCTVGDGKKDFGACGGRLQRGFPAGGSIFERVVDEIGQRAGDARQPRSRECSADRSRAGASTGNRS